MYRKSPVFMFIAGMAATFIEGVLKSSAFVTHSVFFLPVSLSTVSFGSTSLTETEQYRLWKHDVSLFPFMP